jgi:hypothetical protein
MSDVAVQYVELILKVNLGNVSRAFYETAVLFFARMDRMTEGLEQIVKEYKLTLNGECHLTDILG